MARDRPVRRPAPGTEYDSDEDEYWHSRTNTGKRLINQREKAIVAVADPVPMRFKILALDVPPAVKRRLLRYNEQLKDSRSEEDGKRREYMNVLMSVPFGKYALPADAGAPGDALVKLKATLDSAVYSHDAAKLEIMRVVAQWMRCPSSKGISILLCGEHGTGKTELIHAGVAAGLNLPYTFIGLGGLTSASYLKGHGYCYTGSEPGAIVRALVRNESMSQVYLFDEVDKVSDTDRGREIINTLIHLTDETTNTKFQDAYLGDVDIDMSRNVYFFTCNDPSQVSPILLDRMVRIDVEGYSNADKLEIAKRHLVPAALRAFGMKDSQFADLMTDDFIRQAVIATSSEKGVRDLKRAFRAVCAEVNLKTTLDENYVPTKKDVEEILRKETRSKGPACHHMMYN
jgi:ATP-dependent Lon protease